MTCVRVTRAGLVEGVVAVAGALGYAIEDIVGLVDG
jgi:hypothetical protein